MILYDNEEKLIDNLDKGFLGKKGSKGYLNRSLIYLWPALKMLESYNDICGLGNIVAICAGTEKIEGLGIIIETSAFRRFANLVQSTKDREEYITDQIVTINHQVLVLKIPVDLGAFTKGYYSKIYTDEQKARCFVKGDNAAYPVVYQEKQYFPKFAQQMRLNFEVKGSHIPPHLTDDLLEHYTEFDLPPCLNQELLFYKPI